MKSSPISLGLLNSYVERFLPLWGSFLAAWLVFLVMPLGTLAPSAVSGSSAFALGWLSEYMGSLLGCAIAAIVSVCCVFEYLFKRPAALFAGSLPIKRNALFFTTYVAGLLPLLAVELLVFVIIAIMGLVMPQIGFQYVVTWLGVTAGFTFIFYSIAVFCAQLAGTRTTAYYLYLLVNGFVVFIEFAAHSVASALMWGVGFDVDDFVLTWASPFFGLAGYGINVLGGVTKHLLTVNALPILAYCVFAVLLTIASLMLNKRRHLERAENSVAVPAVSIAAKIMGALTFAALACLVCLFCLTINAAYGLQLGEVQLAVLCVVAALASVFGAVFAQSCLLGGFGSLKASFRAGIVVAVCCVAFMLGNYVDVFGVKCYVPASGDVASVEVGLEGTSTTLTGEQAVEAVTQVHKEVLTVEDDANAEEMADLSLSYSLKDGSKLDRTYRVPQYGTLERGNKGDNVKAIDQTIRDLEDLLDSKEGVESRFTGLADKSWGDCTIMVESDAFEGSSMSIKAFELKSYVNDALLVDVRENGFGKCYEDADSFADLDVSYDDADGRYVDFFARMNASNSKAQVKWIKEHYAVDVSKAK